MIAKSRLAMSFSAVMEAHLCLSTKVEVDRRIIGSLTLREIE